MGEVSILRGLVAQLQAQVNTAKGPRGTALDEAGWADLEICKAKLEKTRSELSVAEAGLREADEKEARLRSEIDSREKAIRDASEAALTALKGKHEEERIDHEARLERVEQILKKKKKELEMAEDERNELRRAVRRGGFERQPEELDDLGQRHLNSAKLAKTIAEALSIHQNQSPSPLNSLSSVYTYLPWLASLLAVAFLLLASAFSAGLFLVLATGPRHRPSRALL